jgi:hypothetical protein
MLGNGKERVDAEVGKRRGGERAGYEAFCDPGGDSVGDFSVVLVSGGGVWGEDGG